MPDRRSPLRISRTGLLVSLVFLVALVAFTVLHAGEARHFALLAEQAEPLWLLAAAGFQVGTYLCAGGVWSRVATAAGHRLSSVHLARLSIEKLSVDQFLPAGGMSGNLVVLSAMRRMGLPAAVATEALLIDTLSHYAAYATAAAISVAVLWLHHGVTPVVISLVAVFALLIAGVPLAIAWLLEHRDWKPGPRLARVRMLSGVMAALENVSVRRVWNWRLLGTATALQLGILVLDAATIWAMLQAVGTPAHPLTTFVAVVMATIAGILSLLPGGLGSFEAVCTATLALLGVPVAAALTGTLLFRGLALWLPLLPGLFLARRDLSAPVHRSQRHSLSAAELASTDTAAGLSEAEAARRLTVHGPNVLEAGRRRAVFLQFLSRFKNPLVLLLLSASALEAATGDFASAAIVIVLVAFSVTLDFVQEHRAGRAADELRKAASVRACVVREGKSREVHAEEVVPGDVVLLAAGDLVPADGELVEARDLFLNQALLTGEPYPVEKRPGPGGAPEDLQAAVGTVFMGTSVVSGSARAVVTRTGSATGIGQIGLSLARQPPPTAFEVGTRNFGLLILRLTILLVAFVLLVNVVRGQARVESFLFAIALAVGLAPELLPMVVSVTLARGALRMAKKKVLVKRLAAIHDLGSMDVLCTDKTGTLTEARIRLDQHLDPQGRDSARVLELAFLNSHFESGLKSPLDEAILRHEEVDVRGWEKLDEVPFDFERRRISVLVCKGDTRLLVVKGALEDILGLSTHYEAGPSDIRALDAGARREMLGRFESLGREGYRVLGIAWKAEDADRRHVVIDDETELVFAGFAAFEDPPKESAGQALRSLAEAGVDVVIVTGDNELVARHVCEKVGVPVRGVVTGSEIEALDDHALEARVESINLFCRVTPGQKNRVIRALKRRGHVVGYLGDGINDAPSLHAADVGLSVDSAADVAKDAADLILLEHDLRVIRDGIIEGRHTLGNIVKYILMGTSSNFGNMFSMAGASVFLPFLPMRPMQILVNNFLYDLSEVPIPTDEVDEVFIARPHRWDMRFIRRFMVVIGPVSSVFDFATFFILLHLFSGDERLFHTGWFVESLATQVLVIFVIRTQGNPFRSRPSRPLVLTSLAVVATALLLPFTPAGTLLGFAPLPPAFFAILVPLVVTYLLAVELVKRWFFRRHSLEWST